MTRSLCVLLVVAPALVLAQGGSALRADPPHVCESCEAWNQRKDPSRVFGNTYDVGVAGLGSILITSAGGHILLDAGLPQSSPIIDENIRELGFRTEDIRLIANSHAHYDHAGGIAAIQRVSGAMVAAGADGARALERGEPTANDPQYGFGSAANRFPAVKNARIVSDGEVLRVADLAITAHLTPGHTPGSTTWSWQSCEGQRCQRIVYADSLNPVSAPDFRFTGDAKTPSRIEAFRRSIAKVRELPCDVLLAVHPSFARGKTCRGYADDAATRLEERIKAEIPPEKQPHPGEPALTGPNAPERRNVAERGGSFPAFKSRVLRVNVTTNPD